MAPTQPSASPIDGSISNQEGLARSFRVGSLLGVPLYLHRSLLFPWPLLISAVWFSIFVGFSVQSALSIAPGLLLLIGIHEIGHYAAARAVKLRVLAIEVSAVGGRCITDRPKSSWQAAVLFAGGTAAQLVLLTLTIAAIEVFGVPHEGPWGPLAFCFTFANAVLIVINLIPVKDSGGLHTDGYWMWRLLMHAIRGEPNPMPPIVAPGNSPIFSPDTSLLAIPHLVPRGFNTGIEILNDATTPMVVVVDALAEGLGADRLEAETLMLNIHANGGILIRLPAATAERAALAIRRAAAVRGHDLVCRAVSRDAHSARAREEL